MLELWNGIHIKSYKLREYKFVGESLEDIAYVKFLVPLTLRKKKGQRIYGVTIPDGVGSDVGVLSQGLVSGGTIVVPAWAI